MKSVVEYNLCKLKYKGSNATWFKGYKKLKGIYQLRGNVCLLGMESGGKLRINNYINPEWDLADTGENGGLGT